MVDANLFVQSHRANGKRNCSYFFFLKCLKLRLGEGRIMKNMTNKKRGCSLLNSTLVSVFSRHTFFEIFCTLTSGRYFGRFNFFKFIHLNEFRKLHVLSTRCWKFAKSVIGVLKKQCILMNFKNLHFLCCLSLQTPFGADLVLLTNWSRDCFITLNALGYGQRWFVCVCGGDGGGGREWGGVVKISPDLLLLLLLIVFFFFLQKCHCSCCCLSESALANGSLRRTHSPKGMSPNSSVVLRATRCCWIAEWKHLRFAGINFNQVFPCEFLSDLAVLWSWTQPRKKYFLSVFRAHCSSPTAFAHTDEGTEGRKMICVYLLVNDVTPRKVKEGFWHRCVFQWRGG